MQSFSKLWNTPGLEMAWNVHKWQNVMGNPQINVREVMAHGLSPFSLIPPFLDTYFRALPRRAVLGMKDAPTSTLSQTQYPSPLFISHQVSSPGPYPSVHIPHTLTVQLHLPLPRLNPVSLACCTQQVSHLAHSGYDTSIKPACNCLSRQIVTRYH